MSIKLFELDGGKVKATEHCYQLPFLHRIIQEYPKTYLKVFAYLFYMSCRSEDNPFFNRPQEDLEIEVLKAVEADFDPEDDLIIIALRRLKEMYETPTVRAYNGISNMLEKLALYMNTQTITDGRDGNLTAIVQAAKNFDSIRKSFKGVAKDLEEEQSSRARGGTRLAYDA